MESIFGFLPKINRLKVRRKEMKKKIIFLRSFYTFKCFSNKQKIITNIVSYIFNLNNYFYLKFLLNKKYKVKKFEEILKHFFKKKFYLQHKSLYFQNNLLFKLLDFNRKFTEAKKMRKVYKYKNKALKYLRQLKYYKLNFVLFSDYCGFFLKLFFIKLKNYRKLILFIYKMLKRKRKNEKTYLLL